MSKAVLRFSNLSNPDYLIITWALFDTPNAEIGRQAYATPHPQRSLTVTNLQPVMHRFSFWQSIDGTQLTTRLLDMDIDCSINESEFFVFDYVVDRGNGDSTPGSIWADPVAGTDQVNDERLINSTFYVEQRGLGKLRPDEVQKDTTTGFFRLLLGATFVHDDTFFAVVQKIIVQSQVSLPSSDYLDVVQISASANLISSMYRKFLEVITSSNTPVLSIPDFSSVPMTRILINTHAMTGRYFTIAFSGSNTVKFMGVNFSQITLGKGEEIEILFTGTAGKIMRYEGDYRRLGYVYFGRGIEVNAIPLDGSLYNIADFPRLFNDFINKLPIDQQVTMTQWATSQSFNGRTEYPFKGFFAVDTLAGTFRVPDFRNRTIRALKLDVSADTERVTDKPGGFQIDKLTDFRGGASKEYDRLLKHTGTQTTTTAGDNTDLSGSEPNLLSSFAIPSYLMGAENVVRNIGLIPQIII